MAGAVISRAIQASDNAQTTGVQTDINTLVGGTVTCTVDHLNDQSVIIPIREIIGGTVGALSISNRVNGSPGQFDIDSTNVLDTSDIRWVVFG